MSQIKLARAILGVHKEGYRFFMMSKFMLSLWEIGNQLVTDVATIEIEQDEKVSK